MTDMGSECAENSSTASARFSSGNFARADSIFCATAWGAGGCEEGGKRNNGQSTHLDETGVCAPSVNDAPVDARKHPSPAFAEYVVETAARRATTILRVLRKGYRAFHAVLLHAPCGLLCERSRVAERDVALVRRCGWVELVEQCRHALPLQFGPAQNRGTAANVHVLLLDARSPSFGNPWCYDRLERKGDEVPVQEEVSKEVVGF
jgi:hypothetical protein